MHSSYIREIILPEDSHLHNPNLSKIVSVILKLKYKRKYDYKHIL